MTAATLSGVLWVLLSGLGALGWARPKDADPRDTPLWFLAGVPLFLAPAALLLADAGVFSTPALWIGVLLWSITGAFRLRRRPPPLPAGGHLLALLALGLVALVVFARPHPYLYGGWDPGEYVATSTHIRRTGSISYTEPFLIEAPAKVRRQFMHNPVPPRRTLQAGYLVLDEESGAMVPDYFHLYPAWLALFAPKTGAAYAGQTVIALWGLLTVVCFTRRFAGNAAAWLVAPLLLTNPAVVYFARFPSSEFLSMTCVFTLGFLWFTREDRPAPAGAAWIAVAAFSATTAHITNLLPLMGMGLVSGGFGLLRKDRGLFSGAKALALGVALGMIRNFWATPLFAGALLHRYVFQRPEFVIAVIVLLVAAGGGMLLLYRFALARLVLPEKWRDRAHWVPAALILGAGLYHYFLRPRWADHDDVLNLRSLAWLISPAGLWLAWGYLPALDWKRARRATWIFLAAIALSTAVLVHHKHVQPYYMWAFRRYLPVVIPSLALLMAAATILCLRARRHAVLRWVPALLLAGVVAWQVRKSLPFARIVEHDGLPAFTASLAEDMADADFILADHWKFPSPLRHAHGLPAFTLSRENHPVDARKQAALYDFLRRKTEAGDIVYYLSHRGPFFAPSLHPQTVSKQVHQAEVLEWRQSGLPRERQSAGSTANIYRMRARPDPDPPAEWTLNIGYHRLGLLRGFHRFRRSGGESYRWTNGDGALYIPAAPRGGRLTLRLAHMWPDELATDVPVRITLDGAPLATRTLPPGWSDITLPLPPLRRRRPPPGTTQRHLGPPRASTSPDTPATSASASPPSASKPPRPPSERALGFKEYPPSLKRLAANLKKGNLDALQTSA